jgi:hypothetical protein
MELRKEAENMIFAVAQAVASPGAEDGAQDLRMHTEANDTAEMEEKPEEGESTSNDKAQACKDASRDRAFWLYRLVFKSYTYPRPSRSGSTLCELEPLLDFDRLSRQLSDRTALKRSTLLDDILEHWTKLQSADIKNSRISKEDQETLPWESDLRKQVKKLKHEAHALERQARRMERIRQNLDESSDEDKSPSTSDDETVRPRKLSRSISI